MQQNTDRGQKAGNYPNYEAQSVGGLLETE